MASVMPSHSEPRPPNEGLPHAPQNAYRRPPGWVLALFVMSAALVIQYRDQGELIQTYDREHLDAFDAYVYMAMAGTPAVLTVRPCGYRVLTPVLVHALPMPRLRAFRYVTLGGLALTGAVLFLFLRRLGNGEWSSLLAVAVFGLSGPVGETVSAPFLGESTSVLLELTVLLAIASQAATGVLSLLVLLGVLSKEFFFLLLPAVYLSRMRREGRWRALGAAAGAGLPALVTVLILRYWWTPDIRPLRQSLEGSMFPIAASTLLGQRGEWLPELALFGVTPLALLGALRAQARGYLRVYGYLVLLLGLPFVAWINVPNRLFWDGPRLLVYSYPVLLTLCLVAVDRVWRHMGACPSRWKPRPVLDAAAALASALLALLPLALLDRYRRLDLQGKRDGPMILALSQESLRAARHLQAGRDVSWDLEAIGSPALAPDDPVEERRTRWFLREGWGSLPPPTPRVPAMPGTEATFLLPCLAPEDRRLTLSLSASRPMRLGVYVNGSPLGEAVVTASRAEHTFRVPAGLLFRGDNVVGLRVSAGAGPRLHRITVQPVSH